jgi:hypothetical protein
MTREVFTDPVTNVTHQGDPDGFGDALITVNRGQGEVCWELSASNILLPGTAAHIHKAAPGRPGPVVVPLSAPDASGFSAGCRSVADTDLLRDILVNPAAYYVNVHNTDFPPGAIRGQLAR